jgi:hypothetical protein
MKYFSRLKMYKSHNVKFNPETMDAHSYSWWRFVARIDGKIIFNSYRYSVTTAKHQREVRAILNDLGIKIDLDLQLPNGINSYDLAELIVTAEETLCDQFLNEELKRQERNAKAALRRKTKRLEDYLENSVAFRDYEIISRDLFGTNGSAGVHQVVDMSSMERDVENALHSFHRDSFAWVVFYV